MSQYKVDFHNTAWESSMIGARSKSFVRGAYQLRLVEYTKEMQPHWCEKGHIGYILEGTLEIEFERETVRFGPGDGIFIPNGKDHKHRGVTVTDVVRAVFVEDV